jgi:hypothetical protein
MTIGFKGPQLPHQTGEVIKIGLGRLEASPFLAYSRFVASSELLHYLLKTQDSIGSKLF